ncbi:MAG TPA: F0F1 ATP synthase subunit A [Thermoanaerobaculaceae bacterium]|nr:F0F1 ATP synthase subunit A [Thermoanaerobaculaceae bacterium]
MHHEFSILFRPVNALLAVLLGAPSAGWQRAMGLEGDAGVWLPDHVVMALLVVALVAALLIWARRSYSLESPSTVQQCLELLLSGISNLTDDVIGHGRGKDFVPFVAGLTFFLFVSNFFGLIFFLQPPTANTSTTFALSLTTFLFYNIAGIRRHGPLGYAKQFAGPVWWLAPLMAPIEIISHLARVLSLALRLFGNIFGEHTAMGMFLVIVPLFVPAMMGLGLLGATIQTFIFIMLTSVYVSGAVAEEH